ncbi:cellulose biosynthesis protein BcsN [Rhizobium calliandrae]|uniref:Cellulose biosynthesis protein BcsN n=1 Tax=Rhizobium calliandrae TaxID=1312182 RepID=A0ABT7KJ64_9HYPH|nr:cellulose biosynthesis protein BcsN [Rhizobium calliandrae]MDL2408666.1 cellulose biosynthesis protein BcsN [Rhizobium calliandrae]
MHLLKLIALLTLAIFGTSCTTTGGVRQSGGAETIPSDKALAFPPPGGPAIVNVVERRHGNDVEQMISLSTSSTVPGQNFVKVLFLAVSGSTPGLGSTPYKMISEAEIAREIAATIPGVRLSRSATFVQNTYGPFGYAAGRSRAGDTCLYAWQQIRAGRSTPAQQRNFSMVQVRLRLCDARATERQLLSTVYGYTIAGGFEGESLNPYGTPRGADALLGRPGDPIYPDVGGYRNSQMAIGYEARTTAVRPAIVNHRTVIQPKAVTVAPPQAVGPHIALPDPQGGTPQTGAVTAPAQISGQGQRGTMGTNGIVVPSPDCIGDAGTTAACRK